jgi:hypothetical protein
MDQASSFSGEHQPPPMLATHPSHWPRSVTPCANTVVQQATHALPRFAGSRQPCQLSSATSREGMRVFVQCATAASSRIRPSPTWHRSRYCVRFVLVRDMSHVFYRAATAQTSERTPYPDSAYTPASHITSTSTSHPASVPVFGRRTRRAPSSAEHRPPPRSAPVLTSHLFCNIHSNIATYVGYS